MAIDQELLTHIEKLRIPFDGPYWSQSWKDWYHFILIDFQRNLRILVNITLVGKPESGEIQTTFIVSLPTEQIRSQLLVDTSIATFGVAYSQAWTAQVVRRSPLLIQGKNVSLKIDGDRFEVATQDTRTQLSLNFQAQAQAEPLLVTEDSPFGSGFIGWGLVPGLQAEGELSIRGQRVGIDKTWFCYHDRNFGRFRWGEDIGWEWCVAFFVTKNGRKFTLVLDKRTDKDHSLSGLPYIFIYEGIHLRKVFIGKTLQIKWEWSTAQCPSRLPGIMASLFADSAVRMPQVLEIQAMDEQDRLILKAQFDAAVELIVPDNQARQYSFIKEVTGSTELYFYLQEETILAKGLIYAEYVI
ncbi:MAG: hypothetical protein AAGD25_08340 [Cyanobacteria bacterium P01_F01_bin.150]